MKTITLSKQQFEDLGEYSCSIPSNIQIGKIWKKNQNAYRWPVRTNICGLDFVIPWPEKWFMGEYVECGPKKEVWIKWSQIVIDS